MFEIQNFTVSKYDYPTKDSSGDPASPAQLAVMEIIEGMDQKRIGSGAFGVVYSERGSDVVYKVCEAGSNKPYMSFVKQLSKQQQYNPFLPKVYGCAVFTSDVKGDSYFIVVMERLNDHRPGGFYDAIVKVEELVDPYARGQDKSATNLLPGLKTVVPRPLRSAVSLLKRAKRSAGKNAGWDLHGGNFMMRGDNQLVVIDPLA
jgi:hypothetical protein